MLLMDAVIQTAALAVANGIDSHPTMAIYVDLARKLAPEFTHYFAGKKIAPVNSVPPARFVFDENAIRTATELTLGRPKVFREVMRISRVPYPAMWVEWEDAGREKLRQKFPQPKELEEIRPNPERFGFFIEADTTTYRGGKITWAWSQKSHGLLSKMMGRDADDDTPNISGIQSIFDLDADFPIDFIDEHPLKLAELWIDNPVQNEFFHSIWKTVRQEVNEPAIADVVKMQAGNDPRLREFARSLLFADVVGEYIMTWACMILLNAASNRNSTGGGVDIRSVDMSRLNKNRLRSHKTPLLNHRTVHILQAARAPTLSRNPLDYRRKSPHIHLVTSYLGWHGKVIWPYTRGSGAPTRASR